MKVVLIESICIRTGALGIQIAEYLYRDTGYFGETILERAIKKRDSESSKTSRIKVVLF